MPSINDIRAGRAFVEIGTKDSALLAGLNRALARIQAFGNAIRGVGLKVAGVGTAIFSPLAISGQRFAEHGANLELASQKTGVGVEALSGLNYAAQQTGVGSEALEKGIAKMSRTLVQAERGSKEATQSLAELGLTVDQLNGLSQQDRLKLIADRISKIPDPAVRAAAAMGIFGKAGAELLPLLDQGSSGIGKLEDRAKSLGLIWSSQDTKAALTFSRTLKDLWDVLEHGVDMVGAAVAPVLTQMANVLIQAAVAATRWVNDHRQLIATALLVGGALATVGTALVVVGTAISGAGVVLGTLGTIAGIAITAVKAVLYPLSLIGSAISTAWTLGAAAIGLVGPAMGIVATAVGAVLSPLGLVVAAVTAGVAALLYFSGVGQIVGNYLIGAFGKVHSAVASGATALFQVGEVGKEVGNHLIAAFKEIYSTIKFVFSNTSNLSDAWSAAMTIGGTYVMEAWARVKGFLLDLWASTKSEAGRIWDSLSSVIVDAAYTASDAFLNIWARTMRAWQSVVNVTADAIQRTFLDTANDELQKALADIDRKQQAGQLTPDQADKARAAAHKTFDTYDDKQHQQRDAEADAELKKKLDAIRTEADARKKYLDDLRAKQAAQADAQTAQEKAENDKRLADAVATAKAAREAYEAELKKQHDASGDPSLLDQFGKLVGLDPSILDKIKGLQDGTGDLSEGLLGAKAHADGTFSAAAAERIGGANVAQAARDAAETRERIAKATEQTAKSNQATFEVVDRIRNAMQQGDIGLAFS